MQDKVISFMKWKTQKLLRRQKLFFEEKKWKELSSIVWGVDFAYYRSDPNKRKERKQKKKKEKESENNDNNFVLNEILIYGWKLMFYVIFRRFLKKEEKKQS